MIRAALLALLLAPASALAAGALGPEGSRIATSQYTVDLFTGPVISSTRVTGMGGAFAGIAEGVVADPVNPAAPAVRVPWSYNWADYDFSIGVSMPSVMSRSDFDNTGDPSFRYKHDYVPLCGLNLTLGRAAIGVFGDSRRYTLSADSIGTDESQEYSVALNSIHILVARAFWRGQFSAGLGVRVVGLNLTDEIARQKLVAMNATSFETGFLLAPAGRPFRVGVAGRLPVSRLSVPASGEIAANGEGDFVFRDRVYLPAKVELPWEVEAGLAWELGSRPLNQEWVNPDEYTRSRRAEIRRDRMLRAARGIGPDEEALRKEEEEGLARQELDLRERRKLAWREAARSRLLVSASVLVTGSVFDGVGVQSMLKQEIHRSGEHASVTPRLGVETEPIPDLLQVRMGTYLEPGRVTGTDPRPHATAGFDLKLLRWSMFGAYDEWTWWSVGAAVDVASSYTSAGLRAGVWH